MSRLFFYVPLIFFLPSCSFHSVPIIIPLSSFEIIFFFFKERKKDREKDRKKKRGRKKRKRQQPWDLFSHLSFFSLSFSFFFFFFSFIFFSFSFSFFFSFFFPFFFSFLLLFHWSVPCSLRRNQKRRRKQKKKPGLRWPNDTLMTAAAPSLFSPFQRSPNSIFQTSWMQHYHFNHFSSWYYCYFSLNNSQFFWQMIQSTGEKFRFSIEMFSRVFLHFPTKTKIRVGDSVVPTQKVWHGNV